MHKRRSFFDFITLPARSTTIPIPTEICDKIYMLSIIFYYPFKVNKKPNDVASHKVIEEHISCFEKDYRLQDKEHPIKELQGRVEETIIAVVFSLNFFLKILLKNKFILFLCFS